MGLDVGLGVGVEVDEVGIGVGVAVLDTTVTEQGTEMPLSVAAHVLGVGMPVEVESPNPYETELRPGMLPFHDALLTDITEPETPPTAFQIEVIVPFQG